MEFFGMGFGEILVIALVALIVLGPERLPEAARTVGRGISEVRKAVEPARTMWRDISNDLNSVTGTTTSTFRAATGAPNGRQEKIHPILEMMTPEERVSFTSGGEMPKRIADQLSAQANGVTATEDTPEIATAAVELPHLDYAMPHADLPRNATAGISEELFYPAPGNSDYDEEAK